VTRGSFGLHALGWLLIYDFFFLVFGFAELFDIAGGGVFFKKMCWLRDGLLGSWDWVAVLSFDDDR
jgi:hypothetical protein